jgi:hypothetical protein
MTKDHVRYAVGLDSTVEKLIECAREEEREKAAQYLEVEARKHDEAAADIERDTADEKGIDDEARMHRYDAESLRRHAAAIRSRQ